MLSYQQALKVRIPCRDFGERRSLNILSNGGLTALSRTISIEPVDFEFRRQCSDIIESILEELDLSQSVGDVIIKVIEESRRLASITLDRKDGILPFIELAMTQACFENNSGWPGFSEANLKQILYHELMHVSDRLNPAFGAGANDVSNIRSNELWNVWIDGRLSRRGVLVDKPLREDQYQFLFGDSEEARKWFNWLWHREEILTFRELLLLSLELPWGVYGV